MAETWAAEFANVRNQMQALEDSLHSTLESPLTDALTNRKVDAANDIRSFLITVGGFRSFQLHFTKSPPQIHHHKALFLYLEQEWNWCSQAFPEDYTTLVPNLLIQTMMSTAKSFESRVNLVDVPEGVKLRNKHLDALIQLHSMTETFDRKIRHLFRDVHPNLLLDTLNSIYLPYESFKLRYVRMERAVLSCEVAARILGLRGFSSFISCSGGVQRVDELITEAVRKMTDSIPQVILVVEKAFERCINFTGGSEARELVLVLDDLMQQYVLTFQEILKALRILCGVGKDHHLVGVHIKDLSNQEEYWCFVQATLQILPVANSLSRSFSKFGHSMYHTLTGIRKDLSSLSFGWSIDRNILHELIDPAPDVGSWLQNPASGLAFLRLVGLPDKARKVFNLLEREDYYAYEVLPLTPTRVEAFSDAVNELVYEVLTSQVEQQFKGLSRLPVWTSSTVDDDDEASAVFPQPYATNVGEYLVTLSQKIDGVSEGIRNGIDPDADDANWLARKAEKLATKWKSKVEKAAVALYMEQLRGIEYLTDRGAHQLSVDIEYLNDVLDNMSKWTHSVLIRLYHCLTDPRDELEDTVKILSEHDLPTANRVSKLMRLCLDE
ncbi:OLC1v1007180C1 [Oldenlandia corymbosa var. corymbosa]|uniref:Conserved oligomeric Golgi complex subunit 7 n=1 Tax=Oldenlandia corymbosa var. corymbosa TaxID=529605 RepID=A0AAV1DL39_OLDCO|nr:OLC1v1007180C1 [Oldenlandia corymbosa var. corymbosa]